MGGTRTIITEAGHELTHRHSGAPLTDDDHEKLGEGDPSEDVVELARFGKKQVLRASRAGLMATWEAVLTGFILGYLNGGPAGLVYGLIVTWIGTTSVFISMGELASMVPTAGGQYHWVSILAPESCKKFVSYITGWLTLAGWIAGCAATSFFVASLLLAIVAQNVADYDLQHWHVTLLFWAILCLCVFVNTLLRAALPLIEIFVLVLHIVGFFATVIPLARVAEHNTAEYVFTTWNNSGGWSSMALSFMIGLQGNANAFIGTDGAMSEEVQNASRNVPTAMVISTFVNGLMAFATLLVVLFCQVNIDDTLDSQYPFVPIFAEALGSNAGATVLACLPLLMIFASAIGAMASASRMLWAFSRDKGVPGYRLLSKIDQRTTVPVWGIAVVTSIAALLGFINLGSTTAFNDIISLTLEGLFTSYLVAVLLLLYRRLRGEIGERTEDQLWHDAMTSGGATQHLEVRPYTWGPWRLPGIWGILNNLVAVVYLVIICFFSFWPSTTPPTADDMNYSQTVWGAVVILSLVYYVVYARKQYDGPVVEVRVAKVSDDSLKDEAT